MPQHWCSPLLRTTPDRTPASGISYTHGPQEHSREPRGHPALKQMKTYKPGKLKLGNLKAGKPLDWLFQCQNGVIWFVKENLTNVHLPSSKCTPLPHPSAPLQLSSAARPHPSRNLPPPFPHPTKPEPIPKPEQEPEPIPEQC